MIPRKQQLFTAHFMRNSKVDNGKWQANNFEIHRPSLTWLQYFVLVFGHISKIDKWPLQNEEMPK